MKNIILSTSGHIDHGKTRLIEELSGKNTMHHKDEFLRNITIDLGYSNLVLKDEINISIIDVPGHQDYLKNTICGILNSNISILVISAVDGVCLQTQEHFAIINQTSINHIIIAVTKVDIASYIQVKNTLYQIKELISKSNIDNIETVTINYKQKESIENLKSRIYFLAKNIKIEKNKKNIFRIDNSFNLKGYGTIISGNLISGSLSKNDDITIYPKKINTKIKNIQSHLKNIENSNSNIRLALNISKISKNEIARGDTASTFPDLENSKIIDILVSTTNISRKIKNYENIRFFLGTCSGIAKIINLQDRHISPNSKFIAQLRLEDEILCFRCDEVILLDTSSREIIAGGKIINTNSLKKSKIDYEISSYDINYLILLLYIKEKKIADMIFLKNELNIEDVILNKNLYNLSKERKIKLLSKTSDNIRLSDTKNIDYKILNYDNYLIMEYIFYKKISEKLKNIIEEYAKKNIYKSNMNLNEIYSKINYVEKKHIDIIISSIDYTVYNNHIVLNTEHNTEIEAKYKEISYILSSSNAPIPIKNIITDNLIKEILYNHLKEHFVKISDDYICSNDTINNYKNILYLHFEKNKKLEISDFRNYSNLSRKLCVAVLEYFDLQKITKRFENYRIKYINFK